MKIKFTRTEKGIEILIPTELLAIVAEENPEYPVKVNDKERLADLVMNELEHNLGDDSSGCTGFQELLDEAVQSIYEQADDCLSEPDEEDE